MTAILFFVLQATVLGHVRVAETAGRPFDGVVRAGVRFENGLVFDPQTIDVRGGGRVVRAEARAIDRHPDGSLRRTALIFPARLGPGTTTPFEIVRHDPSVVRAEAPDIDFEETGEGVLVRARGLSVLIPADVSVAVARIHFGGESPVGRIFFPDTSGIEGTVLVEERGPWRVTCVQRGTVRNAEGREFGVVRRVAIDADGATIAIETTVSNDAFFGVTRPFDLVFESTARLETVTTEWGMGTPKREDDRFGSAVAENGDVTPVGFERTRPTERRSPGAVRGRYAFGTVDLHLEDFEFFGPGTVSSIGRSGLTATLVGDDYHFWPGVRPTRAARFRFHPPRAALSPLAGWSRPIAYRRPTPADSPIGVAEPTVALSPRRGLGSRVLGVLDPVLAQKAGLDWRGAENAGDWRWSLDDAGNLEFDTTFGIWTAGALTDDPASLVLGLRAARHLVARDVDWARSGIPIRHGKRHRAGGLEAGHVWIEGLSAVADQTADPVLVEALDRMAPTLLTFTEKAPVERWNTRSIGWALVYLGTIADRLGREAVRPAVARILDRLESAPGSLFIQLEPADEDTGQTTVSTWVSAGILGTGIASVRSIEKRPAVQRRFDAMVEALTLEAWDEKEKALADRVLVDRSGEGARTRGLCTGEQMLFFALGGRFAEGSGAAAERARKDIVRAAATRLDFERKVFKGKELSQILWLGPRLHGAAFYRD